MNTQTITKIVPQKRTMAIEARAEAAKDEYTWFSTCADGKPLPAGILRVMSPRCAANGKPDGYLVSFTGCTCPAKGFCRHMYLMGAYHLEAWYAGMPETVFATATNRPATSFRCEHCEDRVFGTPVKPCATSGLFFCSDSCMDEFFESLNAGHLDGRYTEVAR